MTTGRNFKKITQSPVYRQSANAHLSPGTASHFSGYMQVTKACFQAFHAFDSIHRSRVSPQSFCIYLRLLQPHSQKKYHLFWSYLAPPCALGLTQMSAPHECLSECHLIRVMPIPNSHFLSLPPIDSGRRTHHYTEQLVASILHTKAKTLSCSSLHFNPAHGQARSGCSKHW